MEQVTKRFMNWASILAAVYSDHPDYLPEWMP